MGRVKRDVVHGVRDSPQQVVGPVGAGAEEQREGVAWCGECVDGRDGAGSGGGGLQQTPIDIAISRQPPGLRLHWWPHRLGQDVELQVIGNVFHDQRAQSRLACSHFISVTIGRVDTTLSAHT